MSLAKKQKKDEKTVLVLPARVTENGRTISVLIQVNGMHEEDLQIDLEKTQLRISNSKQNVKAHIITVPEGSRLRKKTFHDGILDIVLERP
jgi:HSP20 family molecular chaperone IbpA